MNTFVATLDISDMLYSIGAEHYYGRIGFPCFTRIKNIEVTRPLSAKEALYLNKKDKYSCNRYAPGVMTEKFNSEREVIKYALRFFKKEYPNHLLLNGNIGSYSAQPLIYWPDKYNELANKINTLAKEWNDIDGYEGNFKRASVIDKEWQKLLESFRYP